MLEKSEFCSKKYWKNVNGQSFLFKKHQREERTQSSTWIWNYLSLATSFWFVICRFCHFLNRSNKYMVKERTTTMMLSPVPVLTTASAIQPSQTAASFPSDISNSVLILFWSNSFDQIQIRGDLTSFDQILSAVGFSWSWSTDLHWLLQVWSPADQSRAPF